MSFFQNILKQFYLVLSYYLSFFLSIFFLSFFLFQYFFYHFPSFFLSFFLFFFLAFFFFRSCFNFFSLFSILLLSFPSSFFLPFFLSFFLSFFLCHFSKSFETSLSCSFFLSFFLSFFPKFIQNNKILFFQVQYFFLCSFHSLVNFIRSSFQSLKLLQIEIFTVEKSLKNLFFSPTLIPILLFHVETMFVLFLKTQGFLFNFLTLLFARSFCKINTLFVC